MATTHKQNAIIAKIVEERVAQLVDPVINSTDHKQAVVATVVVAAPLVHENHNKQLVVVAAASRTYLLDTDTLDTYMVLLQAVSSCTTPSSKQESESEPSPS